MAAPAAAMQAAQDAQAAMEAALASGNEEVRKVSGWGRLLNGVLAGLVEIVPFTALLPSTFNSSGSNLASVL